MIIFQIKNYKKGDKKELVTLSTQEFVRRFALHILTKGFTRIRHYGILSSSWKKKKLPALQECLQSEPLKAIEVKQPLQHRKCPSCKKGNLITLITFSERGPPSAWKELLNYDD